MLKRVSSTFYWTRNMDESVAFYRDVLGLGLRVRYGEDWAEFDVGGSTVAIHGSSTSPPSPGGTVVFEVEDIEETMGVLEERGVRFLGGITDVPYTGRIATFRDPAGNVIQIFQPGPAPRGDAGGF